MVMLPSQLEELISGLTPEEMVKKLREEDCLSAPGQERPDEVVALINQTTDLNTPAPGEPHMIGPSVMNYVTAALLDSPFLNEKGKSLHSR